MNEVQTTQIENKILKIRNCYVMIDRDLAMLYQVETKRINEQVKRNSERFPENFVFRLTDIEKNELVANCDRFESLKHSSSNPYAFTEQGVAMLSAVLKSDIAVKMSIQIINAFVAMRHFLQSNAHVFAELDAIKKHMLQLDIHTDGTDKKIEKLFSLMDKHFIENKQGLFFRGQIFDAYAKFEHFIAEAKREIILIDNYADFSVLERFTKKASSCKIMIYTSTNAKLSKQDIEKFNKQYKNLEVKYTDAFHNRFLIIDKKILYHIGASLKDLGKKCFAFDILDSSFIKVIIENLEQK